MFNLQCHIFLLLTPTTGPKHLCKDDNGLKSKLVETVYKDYNDEKVWQLGTPQKLTYTELRQSRRN